MTQFWDNRYSTSQFFYGKEPNRYFSSELKNISPGNTLFPGEGEGRNAIYAARNGWSVDAFDQSRMGYQKAIAFASELDLQINYDVCRLEDFIFKPGHYDVVALIYFHVGRTEREYLHRKACGSLKPGGRVILEAFHKDQNLSY
jgi:2-polyprenyl-3-methyl-5-hydroxy-6-metoxy-1,4-benzoquinol methylase